MIGLLGAVALFTLLTFILLLLVLGVPWQDSVFRDWTSYNFVNWTNYGIISGDFIGLIILLARWSLQQIDVSDRQSS